MTSHPLQVAELKEVEWLVQLPDLRVLWLSDNPCADVPNYRQKVRLYWLPRRVGRVTVTDHTESRRI